jgi:hypothetical protein
MRLGGHLNKIQFLSHRNPLDEVEIYELDALVPQHLGCHPPEPSLGVGPRRALFLSPLYPKPT